MSLLHKVFVKQDHVILRSILEYMDDEGVLSLFSVNKFIWGWYISPNKQLHGYLGLDFVWAELIARDFPTAHSLFHWEESHKDEYLLRDYVFSHHDMLNIMRLKKIMVTVDTNSLFGGANSTLSNPRLAMPTLYRFLISVTLLHPLSTIYKIEAAHWKFGDSGSPRHFVDIMKSGTMASGTIAEQHIERLRQLGSEHVDKDFINAYSNLLRLILKRLHKTGGSLAYLRLDKDSLSGGAVVDFYSQIGQVVDINTLRPLRKESSSLSQLEGAEVGAERGENANSIANEERDQLRHWLSRLGFVATGEGEGEGEEEEEEEEEGGRRGEVAERRSMLAAVGGEASPSGRTKPFCLDTWCRLYIDNKGRLCSLDWGTMELVPVSFTPSGCFTLNMTGMNGEIAPFLHMSPINGYNPEPYTLSTYRIRDLTLPVPDRSILHSLFRNRILEHNKRVKKMNTGNSGTATQVQMREGLMLRPLPDSEVFLDGFHRCTGGLPTRVPEIEGKTSISVDDVKQLYYRECIKSLYPLFAPYGGHECSGLFYGCFAVHGNETIKLSLEPFTGDLEDIDSDQSASSGEKATLSLNKPGEMQKEGEGGERDEGCVKNARWIKRFRGSSERREHYMNIDISQICEVPAFSADTPGTSVDEGSSSAGAEERRKMYEELSAPFGLQLQGLKISGDPNVPGGQLSFCFSGFDALPAQYAPPRADNTKEPPNFDERSKILHTHTFEEVLERSNSVTDLSDDCELDFVGPPLLLECMISHNNPEFDPRKYLTPFWDPRSPQAYEEGVKAQQRKLQANINKLFMRPERHHLHGGSAESEIQTHTSWQFPTKMEAEFASLARRELGNTINLHTKFFPRERIPHITAALQGYAAINQVEGKWMPRWSKAALVMYDRHVYDKEDVVFSILFHPWDDDAASSDDESTEEGIAFGNYFYIDFRPFRPQYDV